MVTNFSKKQKGDREKTGVLLKICSVLFLVVVVLLIFANIKLYQKKKELAVEIANYTKQIQEIQKSSQTLKDEIANSNNQDYIEKVAREEQDMQKPGETVVSFVMPKNNLKQNQTQNNNIFSTGFWTNIWHNVVEFFKP